MTEQTVAMDEGVYQSLRAGAVLVTANNRLARDWRGRFVEAAGGADGVWRAPDILPWGAWLRRLWDEASWLDVAAPLLLDAHQAEQIWRRIVERDASEQGLALLQSAGGARLAREAWALAREWRLTLPFDTHEVNEDVSYFQRWADQYDRLCHARGWVDEAALPALLIEALALGRVRPPAHVLLYGFEEWSPLRGEVLDALRLRGVRVERLEDGLAAAPRRGADERQYGLFQAEAGSRAARLDFADAAAEDEAAARWARAMLDEHPGARLAIIAPDLRDRRARLGRLLDSQLAPHTLLPGGDDEARPWNISLGLPLREYGMVRDALLVLALGEARLPLEVLGPALLSPFIGHAGDEGAARALLDARLRALGERTLSGERVRRLAASEDESIACPRFGRMLARLREARQAGPRIQSPAAWARDLRGELKLAGWPGQGVLGSRDFQLRQAWLETFVMLARLDMVQPRMSRAEAVSWLRQLAGDTLFQPEAMPDAPVQVLGPLEAVGLSFDAVWLIGMHSGQWPPEARPNPFLPMRMQARLGLPHASPERELGYLRRISARLLALAPEVIVSHPRQQDGQELEPSPLFEHLPLRTLPLAGSNLPLPEAWSPPAVLERLSDAQAPALGVDSPAPGGSRMLELQSACPFRAFAELRLDARALETPALGPDARTRGNLLHALMERLWGELGDQARLSMLVRGESFPATEGGPPLRDRVEHHARSVVDDEARARRDMWPERLQRLETQRLTRLALEWLAVEVTRPPFEVEACEQRRMIEIGGLRVRVKLDRVDRLPDGARLVIDYKTGAVSSGDWSGERPVAPQLPLYALHTENARGIAFAQVRAGDCQLKGRIEDAQGWESCKGVTAGDLPWSDQLDAWHAVLDRLATDFREGRAQVDPRQPGVCTHCPLTMLCRIHEKGGAHGAMEEMEA
ncbi:MAG: PD-(D/E)XK nuclease family protein [Pseudomonadota bacterium]